MNKQQLASKIWKSANEMRGKMDAIEYKDYILGFLFYKYLSDNIQKYWLGEGYAECDLATITEDDAEVVKDAQDAVGYFIEYKNLFSTWRKSSRLTVAMVRDALNAFSRNINPLYEHVFGDSSEQHDGQNDIFRNLSINLNKLGSDTKALDQAVSELVTLLADVPTDSKTDVLGFIYEYLIALFAGTAGKKAGEFYTPHEVSDTMSRIVMMFAKLSGWNGPVSIYDPTSGSGSLLLQLRDKLEFLLGEKQVKCFAQELNTTTYNLSRMNLVMRGVSKENMDVRNADTLLQDWPKNNDDPLYVDAVVSNPPYSQKWNPELAEDGGRFGYGKAPKGKADYAFLLHSLYHLKPTGIMTIVLPHGVLFRGGEEGTIRQRLIEQNHIEAIIGLPANIFYGTGIPTIIMVLRKNRQDDDGVLVIDASKGFEKVGKNNRLRECDIQKIVDTFSGRLNIDKYSRLVSRDEIRKNDYNLNIPRYVDSSEEGDSYDISSLMFGGVSIEELSKMKPYWDVFDGLVDSVFEMKNDNYCVPKVEDVIDAVKTHFSVMAWKEAFCRRFDNFESELESAFVDPVMSGNVAVPSSDVLREKLFACLDGVELVDKYDAYEVFAKCFSSVVSDFESISGTGLDPKNAIRMTVPNMVIKKKNNKDVEVQDGWVGLVVPFELYQDMFMHADKTALIDLQNEVSDVRSEYESILDGMSEEDKMCSYVNEDGTKFVWSEVKRAIKHGDVDGDLLDALKKALRASDLENQFSKQLKVKQAEFDAKTKSGVESMSDADIRKVLTCKWVGIFMNNVYALADNVIDNLARRVDALSKKYSVTFEIVDFEIRNTSSELACMMEQLVSNDADDMAGLQAFSKMLMEG